MNNYFLIGYLILFNILLKNYSYAQNNKPSSFTKEAKLLIELLNKHHIAPRKLDTQFGNDVFEQLLKTTDQHHVYFLQQDYAILKTASKTISEDILNQKTTFVNIYSDLLKKRLSNTLLLLEENKTSPLPSSKIEIINALKIDSNSFAKNDIDLKLKWAQLIKFKILWNWLTDQDSSSFIKESISAHFIKNEKELRKKTILLEIKKNNKLLHSTKGFEKELQQLFLKAVSACYDAHTEYMSIDEGQTFQDHISTKKLSFGIDLEEEEGNIKINRLSPGGPAWKSNKINKGDQLISITSKEKIKTELYLLDIEEVYEIIEAPSTKSLEFEFKKNNGEKVTIELSKEEIKEEENTVKGYILKGEKKIGYISLPGFYTEWENQSVDGSANDVAKEILKLKSDNIQGLILDLRNNGGGSLSEGINLAGIFINEGPILMIQSSNKKTQTIKDPNRGTIFDEPLVVIVNNYSASASELLAAVLQDYNRAIIVGSNTYGKATGQMFLNLDTINKYKSELGTVKITMNKLYRLKGNTAQLKGVSPDVILPNQYEKISTNESDNDFHFPNDSVSKKVIYAPLPKIDLETIRSKSNIRTNKHPAFKKIQQLNAEFEDTQKDFFNKIPLVPEPFKSKYQKSFDWFNELQMIDDKNTQVFKIELPSFYSKIAKYNKLDESEISILQDIQEDSHIEESYHIITDYINLLKTK
ncbi:MAG: hypothetical protein EAZ07_01440 [Cytophagales bacterium]|nr:MAG: hypothetical protein EAZ07_01440 [Cytophagales bacterium]